LESSVPETARDIGIFSVAEHRTVEPGAHLDPPMHVSCAEDATRRINPDLGTYVFLPGPPRQIRWWHYVDGRLVEQTT